MNKICAVCGENATHEYINGSWFCERDMIGVLQYNDLNKRFIKITEEMDKKGIKRNSIKWIRGNRRAAIRIMKGKIIKENYGAQYRSGGLWLVLKVIWVQLTTLK